jgi:hypothetical protein
MIASEGAEPQGVAWSKTRPALQTTEKQELVDRGFLHLERRGRSKFITLADRAWAWAESAKDVKLPRSSSPVGAEALEALLHRVLPFLHSRGIALADIFVDAQPGSRTADDGASERVPASGPRAASPTDLADRIEQACLSLAGGARKTRVRLSELREALGDVERAAVDQALLDMQQSNRLVLYRDDNTAALTAEDHRAALSINGAPRHLVLLEA